MNRERLLAVARDIEADPKHFDMSAQIIADCGTLMCIAGFAYTRALETREWEESEYVRARHDIAGEYLDLNSDQMEDLFSPEGWRHKGEYSLTQSLRTIRHFAETGIIDWSITE